MMTTGFYISDELGNRLNEIKDKHNITTKDVLLKGVTSIEQLIKSCEERVEEGGYIEAYIFYRINYNSKGKPFKTPKGISLFDNMIVKDENKSYCHVLDCKPLNNQSIKIICRLFGKNEIIINETNIPISGATNGFLEVFNMGGLSGKKKKK